MENIKQLQDFYLFYKKTMERVQASYHTPIQAIEELLQDPSFACLFLVFYKEKIVGGSIFLTSGKQVFHWINASDYEYRQLCGNYLIMSEAISHFNKKGASFLNMGYSHNEKIEKAKTRWGAKRQSYLKLVPYN